MGEPGWQQYSGVHAGALLAPSRLSQWAADGVCRSDHRQVVDGRPVLRGTGYPANVLLHQHA